MTVRRIFGVTWLASTVAASVWIVAFGFAGETHDMLSLNSALAIAFGVVLAAVATFVPAALLTAAFWAIEIKKLQPRPGGSRAQ